MSIQPQELSGFPATVNPNLTIHDATATSTGRSAYATQSSSISLSSSGSLLDEPWRVTVLPEAPRLPARIHADERGSEKQQLAKTKSKTFETRRNGVSGGKTPENRPQMNADERRSEKKQLPNGNSQLANAKPNAFETRWNGVSRGRKVSRELTRRNTHDIRSHAGVTRRKSFKSGVAGGGTPSRRTRETASDRLSGRTVSGMSANGAIGEQERGFARRHEL